MNNVSPVLRELDGTSETFRSPSSSGCSRTVLVHMISQSLMTCWLLTGYTVLLRYEPPSHLSLLLGA